MESQPKTGKQARAHLVSSPELKLRATNADTFYEMYSKVGALVTPLRETNEAIEQFRFSEDALLKQVDAAGAATEKNSENLAAVHALLAVIYWMYPNNPGYDRVRNARNMLRHAFDAVSLSKETLSESRALGMLIELRVLPFLIRSKKATNQELESARKNAAQLLELLTAGENQIELEDYRRHAFKAIIHEGLGFSYWQLERDAVKAVEVLQASTTCFAEALKAAPMSKIESSSKYAPIINQFLSGFASVAHWDLGLCHDDQSDKLEGPERLALSEEARHDYEKSYEYACATTWNNYKGLSAYMIATSFATESESEIDPKKIRDLLSQATKMGEESLQFLSLWSTYEADFLGGSWIAGYYIRLADYCPPELRHQNMLRSLELVKKAENLLESRDSKLGRWSHFQIGDILQRIAKYYRQTALDKRSGKVGEDDASIAEYLAKSLEYSTKSKKYYREERFAIRLVEASILHADVCYDLLNCNLSDEERKKYLRLGKRACTQAEGVSQKRGWNEHSAQANWILAQILDRETDYGGSAESYMRACEFYRSALSASPAGQRLYRDYEYYMLAWSKIEQAKKFHRASSFAEAASSYSESAELISRTRRWNMRAGLFEAESFIEEAEDKSLMNEDLVQAVESFQKAIKRLTDFIDAAKKEDETLEAAPFEALGEQLRNFCNARVILESSKQAYRLGNIEESLKGLSSAEQIFADLASNPVFSDSLRANELKSMASLCGALRSFQTAQLTGNHELYLEARKIFGQAAEESRSKSLQPLLAGLSNFASFLFYSKEIEKSLDTNLPLDLIAECDRALQSSEANFRKLGNKSFLNMLKASKHILDATIKMSAAEREVERESEKSRLYSEAQKSLSYASRYYEQLGSSSRVKDALKMISEVKSHQKLIPLAHDIIAEIASNQIIYTAIASSSVIEQTPGDSAHDMEQDYLTLEHKVSTDCVSFGDDVEITLTITNLGHDSALGVKIDEAVPEGSMITKCSHQVIDGRSVKLDSRIEAGASKSIQTTFKASSSGDLVWHPALVYLNPAQKYKIARGPPARLTVESNNYNDFASLAAEKKELDEKVRSLRDSRDALRRSGASEEMQEKITEEIFPLNERVSTIEEIFLKTKNEYTSMSEELERVRADLAALNASNKHREDDRASLEAEEKLLVTRIEKRKVLLEQAHLLQP
jgi:uncharacterized repeat protein (TIGR01451 family)